MYRRVTIRLTLAAVLLLAASALVSAGGPRGLPARKPGPKPYVVQNGPNALQQRSGKPSRTETVNNNESMLRKRFDKSTPIKNPLAGKPVSPSTHNLGDTGTHEVGHAVNPKGKPQTPAKGWTWFSHEGNNVKSNATPHKPPTQPGKPVPPSASGIIAILIGL